MRTAHRVRLAAVLTLGAFALHQLRYLIAFGGSSSHELARQGHGYMANALPVLAVIGLSALFATALRAGLGRDLVRGSVARRTLAFAVALLAIYASQESLEGLLAAGHPGGLAALLAGGGWVALPLAIALGALAALLVRALEGIELALSLIRARAARPRAPRVRGRARAAHRSNPLGSPLSFGLARRPPPPALAQ